jgi:hypothetical protein
MPGTIVATKELARTFENEVGSTGGVAKRRWVCMLSDDTLTAGGPPPATELAAPLGLSAGIWGDYHPVHNALRARKITINERFEDNPYAIEVILEYGLVTADELLSPTSRASQWAFESQAGQIPALWYYDGGFLYPLTNSAGDFFPGLVTDESLVRIKVQRNFTSVPYNWLALQNHVNSATYLGCNPNTIKVVAVDVVRNAEEWNNSYQEYYTATASMLYRQSSHLLYLPDVGFNFIGGGQKRRGMVFDAQNGEWVPSANPIALNGFGALVPTGQPAILPRRVNPQANLEAVFGTP